MKKILMILAAIFLLTGCCDDFKREKSTGIVVRDLIQETDEYIVERRMYYTLDSVVIDTIQSGNNSTLHIPKFQSNNVPDDVVDLNDIFSYGDDDPTDYNYTELCEEEWKYLDSLGVYWDNKSGHWRKKKK